MKAQYLTQQRGFALLLMCLATAGLGLIGQALIASQTQHLTTQSTTLTQQQITLNGIRTALLQFSAVQGYDSRTDPGRMPCPSLSPFGKAQYECLHSNVGYLPAYTHHATNHLHLALPHHKWKSSSSINYHYAVSKQLIQPNSLNWSQKVDWNQPTLVIKSNNTLIHGVAAVVAREIQQKDNHLVIHKPYTLITSAEIQERLGQQGLTQTNALFNRLPGKAEGLALSPFVEPLGPNWEAMAAQCQCACTKTRCKCKCENDQPAYWVSSGACLHPGSNCRTRADWLNSNPPTWLKNQIESLPMNSWICRSSDQECVLKGHTAMLNQWPVNHYKPVAAESRNCRPVNANACPTSPTSSPCQCYYQWPSLIRNQLQSLKLTWADGRLSAQRQAAP